jgi:CarboxypepD_reg-like domain
MEKSGISETTNRYYSPMKKDFSLSVPTPCHERWSEFTPTEKGRFCGSCQKEVIDFTQWNEEQIKRYFKQATQSTCGRFRAKQLTTYHEPAKLSRSWLSASVLAFILLMMSRPAEAQSKRKIARQEQVEIKLGEVYSNKIIDKVILHGTVRSSEDSSALPGVNVTRKGKAEGTVTDADGKFEITIYDANVSESLVFSFIGLKTMESAVSIDSPIKEIEILMQDDIQVLGGLVVTRRYSPRRLWWKIKNVFRR